LLERFGLADAADRNIETYSGGMRRRIDLIASLIVRPELLFLDEPTTGLDPRSRGEIWDAVRTLVSDGTTVLLTTQYLDEADQLADDITVVDKGTVIADGTPDQLKARIGDRIDVVTATADDHPSARRILTALAGAEATLEDDRVSVPIQGSALGLPEVVRALDQQGVRVADVALRRPTLDEVFLRLTGSPAAAEPVKEPVR
jgi:ABC-2 type transport system ATP-binding protein